MKISIIVPIYNAEHYLRKCIPSILFQDYENFELILINDGSTDQSGKIADEFANKDSRIRVFHKINGGVSSARNLGIEEATGDYICFIDSDDYIETNYLSAFFKTWEQLPTQKNECLIIQDFNTITNDKIETNCLKNPEETRIFDLYKDKDIHDFLNYSSSIQGHPFNKFYSLKNIKTHNIRFNEEQSFGEDFDFYVNYITLSINYIALTPDSNYNYLVRDNSLTHTQRSVLNDFFRFKSFIVFANKLARNDSTNGLHHIINYLLESGILRRFYNNNETYAPSYRKDMLRKISETLKTYDYSIQTKFPIKKMEYYLLKTGYISVFDLYKRFRG